jgi:CDP-diacylglycerol--glycerol-3-phosphate 3-phosphatidyltransferase
MTGADPTLEPRRLSWPEPEPDHIADPVATVSAWNIANALTMLRLVLVPFFAVALFEHGGHARGWHVIACVIFAVASLTDRIDGDLARKRGLVTEFGKLADPIADKALIGTALVGLSILGDVSWLVTVLVLVREIGVTLLRFWVIRHGVMPASRGGKVKTLIQAIAIGLLVLPLTGGWHAAATAVMWLAVALTLVTGVDYVFRAISLRRRAKT